MCGIAGMWGPGGAAHGAVEQMLGRLVHRGPDGAGLWQDPDAGIVLGHRRLAIIDLSGAGRQPMTSASGRVVITYNGELYNTAELRADLQAAGYRFRGTSDTEVLIHAIEHWGVAGALGRLNGIFAFAVWDKAMRTLALARDRMGVKPLYWARIGTGIAFASELKALVVVPGFDRRIDPAAVGTYLQYRSIRAPLTIYAAARALEPGTLMTVGVDGVERCERYWDLRDVANGGELRRAAGQTGTDHIEALEHLLEDAIRRQMVSDVPLGAFLSGGMDSSTVVALMQKISPRPIRTFTIGFNDAAMDEAPVAKRIAAHLGTDHSELYVRDADALATVPKLAGIYDQPLSDVSGIATYLLCRTARARVTVALSGDGGDELFFGYERYLKADRLRARLARVPSAARRLAARGFSSLASTPLADAIDQSSKVGWQAARVARFAGEDLDDLYLHFITSWPDPHVIANDAPADMLRWQETKAAVADPQARMMLHDARAYLPDGVLAKVDRASMAVGLEARVPLLDHRLVAFAWTLPMEAKLRDGVGKACLRAVLSRHVPRHLIERPKAGFSAPIGTWMRGPLRAWAEHLLSPGSVTRSGILRSDAVQALWRRHLAGRGDVAHQVWSLLMLQSWLEHVSEAPSGAQA